MNNVTRQLQWPCMLLLGSTVFFPTLPAIAQVIPDESLGRESSQINENVNIRGQRGDRTLAQLNRVDASQLSTDDLVVM